MKFKLNPLQQFTLFIAGYSVVVILFNMGQYIFLHLLATLGFGLALFFAFTSISGKKKSVLNTVATSLIIFLLLDYQHSGSYLIYSPLIATFIAISYKFFLEYKGRPIINPTVFALLVLVSIFRIVPMTFENPLATWWGASFREPFAAILLLVWILTGLGVWKKWPLFLSFVIPYAVFTYLFGGFEFTQFVFTTGTIYFLAGIMLVEPKTSPVKTNHQIACGIFAAVVYGALIYYQADNSELIAIAAMNLLNFMMSRAGGVASVSAV